MKLLVLAIKKKWLSSQKAERIGKRANKVLKRIQFRDKVKRKTMWYKGNQSQGNQDMKN